MPHPRSSAAGTAGNPAAARLRADVQGFLDEAEAVTGREIAPRSAAALLVPYDPHPLAGPTAGVGFAAVEVPARCVVVTARPASARRRAAAGAPAVAIVGRPHPTALGPVAHDGDLVAALVRAAGGRVAEGDDAADEAHDVLVPFVQVRNADARVLALRLPPDDWETVRAVAAALHECAGPGDDLLVVGASNLSRDAAGEAHKDRDALVLEHVLALDGRALLDAVRRDAIAMTGAPAAALACEFARLRGAGGGELVAYSNSGIATGRADRVTGYAAVILGAR